LQRFIGGKCGVNRQTRRDERRDNSQETFAEDGGELRNIKLP
jgi:hypothetical protein